MTRTLSPKTETLLQEMALGLGCRRTRWLSALRGTKSRTVPFEEVLAQWKLKRLHTRICRNELVYYCYDRTDDLSANWRR